VDKKARHIASVLCVILFVLSFFFLSRKPTSTGLGSNSFNTKSKPRSEHIVSQATLNLDCSIDRISQPENISPRFTKANIERRMAEMGTVLQKRNKVILTPEEVLALAGEPTGREGEDNRLRESLVKEDWEGHSHLLVQALETGKGIALEHEQVMHFLNGDKGEWSDNSYRWIADELMTILREDLPETTLQDLSSLVTNSSLDDGIRGYALQHVGHLADQGVNVPESLDLMWQSARGGDSDLQSTALLGLYQFAKRHPEQLPIQDVIDYAETMIESGDRNTVTTAEAILKSNE